MYSEKKSLKNVIEVQEALIRYNYKWIMKTSSATSSSSCHPLHLCRISHLHKYCEKDFSTCLSWFQKASVYMLCWSVWVCKRPHVVVVATVRTSPPSKGCAWPDTVPVIGVCAEEMMRFSVKCSPKSASSVVFSPPLWTLAFGDFRAVSADGRDDRFGTVMWIHYYSSEIRRACGEKKCSCW